MPHLERAVRIHSRLHVLQSGIQAVDSLSIGVVCVTATGKVVFANEYARAVLARGDGLSLDRYGLLISSSKSEPLRVLIAKAAEASAGRGLHAGGPLTIERGSGAKAYQLTVMPTHSAELTLSASAPAVIIFIRDPQRHERPSEDLLRAYGLTPAESRVALLLSDGLSPRQIAEMIGVSENTVRSQIKSIFFKTGVKRQGELFRLLLAHSGIAI
jgi:DNA-binding CsgD family transcriptional regulator